MDVSVIILTSEEAENVKRIMPDLKDVIGELKLEYEIILVDNHSKDGTAEEAAKLGATVVQQKAKGFGNAWREGIREASGNHILTLDADYSHPPSFIKELWKSRDCDIVVASRWIEGGMTDQSKSKKFLSLFMNLVYRNLCHIPIRDLNSNFRLYKKSTISNLKVEGKNFEILPEILIKAHAQNLNIKEIPFHYRQRTEGVSKLRILSFGVSYFFMLAKLVKVHNPLFNLFQKRRF